jgi:hypothetical protein
MSNFILVHAGTGTFFSVDDEAFLVNVSDLNDAEFDQFFEEEDVEPIVNKYGFKLTDEFFEKGIIDVNS